MTAGKRGGKGSRSGHVLWQEAELAKVPRLLHWPLVASRGFGPALTRPMNWGTSWLDETLEGLGKDQDTLLHVLPGRPRAVTLLGRVIAHCPESSRGAPGHVTPLPAMACGHMCLRPCEKLLSH